MWSLSGVEESPSRWRERKTSRSYRKEMSWKSERGERYVTKNKCLWSPTYFSSQAARFFSLQHGFPVASVSLWHSNQAAAGCLGDRVNKSLRFVGSLIMCSWDQSICFFSPPNFPSPKYLLTQNCSPATDLSLSLFQPCFLKDLCVLIVASVGHLTFTHQSLLLSVYSPSHRIHFGRIH